MIGIDMYDFRLFVRNCLKTGKADEIIKILIEENILPPIPQGEWINTSPYDDKGECSLCCYLSKKYYNFCPNCGADMRGKEE